MKSYWIFALILTVAYAVYYAINIARDLYGKKGHSKADEEVFELDPDDGQDRVAVTESETGFSVGSEMYKTDYTAVPASVPQDAAESENTETAEERFARIKAKTEASMEDTVPYLSDVYTAEEMYKAMVSGGVWTTVPKCAGNP